MNPITKAIDEILFEIPQEILTQVFVTQDMISCGAALSLETRIREAVIERRVVVDLDLFGTNEDYISLDAPCRAEYIDPYTVVYYVPEEVTQNRPIRQLFSVHFGVLGYQNAGQALRYSESALGSEVRKVLDSALRIPPALTSYMNLLNPNTFMVRFVTLPYPSAFLRCRLGADSELNFLRPTSIPMFAELCVHAIKAFLAEASAKYRATSVPCAIARQEHCHVVRATVSGNFPGSPILLTYRFELQRGLIAALEITA